jgi:hypothetical protein
LSRSIIPNADLAFTKRYIRRPSVIGAAGEVVNCKREDGVHRQFTRKTTNRSLKIEMLRRDPILQLVPGQETIYWIKYQEENLEPGLLSLLLSSPGRVTDQNMLVVGSRPSQAAHHGVNDVKNPSVLTVDLFAQTCRSFSQ